MPGAGRDDDRIRSLTKRLAEVQGLLDRGRPRKHSRIRDDTEESTEDEL